MVRSVGLQGLARVGRVCTCCWMRVRPCAPSVGARPCADARAGVRPRHVGGGGQERVAMERTIASLAAEESPFKPATAPS
jgi:hypothetical protein